MSTTQRQPGPRAGPAALSAAVAARAARYFPELAPGTAAASSAPQRHLFAKASHLRCRVEGRGHDGGALSRWVYLKRDPLAGSEHATLALLWAAGLGRPGAPRIPRPLDYWPDAGVLLTEYTPGQAALLPWLVRFASPLGGAGQGELAREHVRGVAAWLAAFQRATSHLGEIPLVDERAAAVAQLRALPHFAAAERRQIEARLAPAALVAAPAVAHGHFAARNILVGAGAVTVLDWEQPLVRRHPLYDVHTFILNLERRRSYPFCDGARIAALQRAFLDRYLELAPGGLGAEGVAASRLAVLIHQLGAQHRALRRGGIGVIIRRRRAFIGYLRRAIWKGAAV